MPLITALAISIGVLGGIATWLFVGPLAAVGLQIWAAFIAWGAYYHSGGKEASLKTNIPAHIWGALLAWASPQIFWKAAVVLAVILLVAAAVGRVVSTLRTWGHRRTSDLVSGALAFLACAAWCCSGRGTTSITCMTRST